MLLLRWCRVFAIRICGATVEERFLVLRLYGVPVGGEVTGGGAF